MTLFFRICLALTLLGFGALSQAAPVHAGSGVEIGYLACRAIPGTRLNLLVTSSVDVRCTFKSPLGVEFYRGETGIGLGVDLSIKSVEKIDFAVIGATSNYRIGAHSLSGKYVGGKASASAGVGVGAAALVGGGSKNFSLQPVALEGNTGFGASAGLGYLTLEPDAKRRPRRYK